MQLIIILLVQQTEKICQQFEQTSLMNHLPGKSEC